VVHEDDDVLVVDKPAGVVVHPGRGNWSGTLVAGLLARPGFERAPFDPRDPLGRLRPGIVHRIDKDTSGLLVVAKNERAREGLKVQLAAHTVSRVYRALTLGVPKDGRVESLHARHPTLRRRFTSFTEVGRRAVTHMVVEERLASGRAALVACRLETGRTHQIRVHLAERAATPILADALYGRASKDPEIAAVASALGRQALHAGVLVFQQPITGAHLSFESELPEDLTQALERLRTMP
jgi:23S rRNA pseudouridine1911/1915/1917 synthase